MTTAFYFRFGAVVLFVCSLVAFSTLLPTTSTSYSQRFTLPTGGSFSTLFSQNHNDEDINSTFIQADDSHAYDFANECRRVSHLHDVSDANQRAYKLPDDIQEHYESIMAQTARWRNLSIFAYIGHKGPWIENMWIDRFCCDLPQSHFGIYVPLFIQWYDIRNRHRAEHEKEIFEFAATSLRDDVQYITVSHWDLGFVEPYNKNIAHILRRVVVFSAGGFGHVPIPLLRVEMDQFPLSAFPAHQDVLERNFYSDHNESIQDAIDPNQTYLISFAGKQHRSTRKEVLDALDQALEERSLPKVFRYEGRDWRTLARRSVFALAPRGVGPPSYRMFEMLQLGVVPIDVWGPYEWIPYKHALPWHDMSLSLEWHPLRVDNSSFDDNHRRLRAVVGRIEEIIRTPERIEKMRETIRSYRRHFTYNGTLDEIEKFFKAEMHVRTASRRADGDNVIGNSRETSRGISPSDDRIATSETDPSLHADQTTYKWSANRTSIESANSVVRTRSHLTCSLLHHCTHFTYYDSPGSMNRCKLDEQKLIAWRSDS